MKPNEGKPLSKAEVLEKLKTYCAYQERSKRQVIQKMNRLGVEEDLHNDLLEALFQADYLNTNRFAETVARGKSRAKGWAEQKIKQRLQFELGQYFDPDVHLKSIDEDASREKLIKDLRKKNAPLEAKADKNRKDKLLRFCLYRGFGLDASLQILKMEFRL